MRASPAPEISLSLRIEFPQCSEHKAYEANFDIRVMVQKFLNWTNSAQLGTAQMGFDLNQLE